MAATIQSTSQSLVREIPDIVRKAVKTDLREFPRYEVKMIARLEYNGKIIDAAVRDISEGGACIDAAADLAIGDQIAVTFPA